MSESDENQMETMARIARESVLPESVDPAASTILITRGGETIDLRKMLPDFTPAPFRPRGTVKVFDAESFNKLLQANAPRPDDGAATIFIDRNPTSPAIVAVMNGNGRGAHGASNAGWGDHRIQLEFRKTPQWVKWQGIDGKMMGQTEFAEFIEENIADVSDPAGATMLEIATQFSATRTAEFKRATVLQSGQVKFINVETLDGKVGPGEIDVPQIITLGLQPFLGVGTYAIPARFRFRLTDGRLTLGVKLERIEDLMAKVIDEFASKIEPGDVALKVEGIAPSPATSG